MNKILSELEPAFSEALQRSIEQTEATYGVRMVPYMGIRDPYEQAALWRQSRGTYRIQKEINSLKSSDAQYLAHVIETVGPKDGPWATNAIPGKSWHQWGQAADLYWSRDEDQDGAFTPEWNDLSGYRVFAEVCRVNGLTSGYFWRSRDAVHVQLSKDSSPRYSIKEISDQMEARFE